MKNFVTTHFKTAVVLIAAALICYSCAKDGEEEYTLLFSEPALYFDFGDSQTASYNASANVSELSISSKPEGWSAELNSASGRVKVTAPQSLESYEQDDKTITPEESGTVVLSGKANGHTVTAALYVALGDVVDFSGRFANSYLLEKASTGYRIPAARPDGSAVTGIESVGVVWMTERYLIRYADFKNGMITFSTNQTDNGELMEGNALLGAYDGDGNILWCWHLWATSAEPEQNAVQLNGHTFMGCNLGAFGNTTADTDEVLASYGLYYQWGRPSPFPRPRYYDCAASANQAMFNGKVSSVYMSVEQSDGSNSTMAAAVANPLVFITGLTAPWSGGEAWSDSSKSNCDPCPAGWRVPQSTVFAGLTIDAEELVGEMQSLKKTYGWTLTDGDRSAFFFAGGRRSYVDGAVINMNTQETPQPWEGFYWTSSADASRSTAACMFFDLDTENAAASRLLTSRSLQLSNGLQIRCVKE